MEKGFNDDELADIMNEIESLEKEFSHDDKEAEPQAASRQEQETGQGTGQETENVETRAASEAQEETSPAAEQADASAEVQADREHEHEHAPEPEQVAAHHAEREVKEEMGEVLGDLAQMPEEKALPQDAHSEPVSEPLEDNLHRLEREPRQQCGGGSHTAMSFHVEGDMKFELSFHIGGKFVGLTVTEEGLEIGLDGGAKFTVPVEEVSAAKKAS